MRKIDITIIEFVERRISQPLQAWTGVDCFWIARLLFCVAALLCCFEIGHIKGAWVGIVIWPMYGVSNTWMARSTMGNSGKFRNPLKINRTLIWTRWVMFFLLALHLLTWIYRDLWQRFWAYEDALAWLAMIFMACDPLPPGTTKFREFLNSMKMRLVPVRAEN